MPVWSQPLFVDEKTLAVLGDSGIVLGLDDAHGCRWRWEGDDPWSPSPGVRAVTGDRANNHGSWDATRFYGARNSQFRGIVTAPTHAALHAAKQRLFAAVTVTPFHLRCIEPGFDRYVMARRDGEVLWTELKSMRAASYSLSLAAPDPVIRSTQEHVVTWQADGYYFTATNHGTEPMPLRLTIAPTSLPTWRTITIRNATTGRQLLLDTGSSAPVVPTGQTLTVDTDTRRITSGTGTSRRSLMTGSWVTLAPGANAMQIEGLAASTNATMTWEDGWI